MTRSERPGSGLYEEDFYSWTQQQAAALRALPQVAVDEVAIDRANLAEEIEDLGTRDLREVMSYLRLVVQHLVKLQALPAARDAGHWYAEAVNFQAAVREAFSPSMQHLIDIEEVWTSGCRAAARVLQNAGAPGPSPGACPFSLDDLLAAEFDVAAAVGRLAPK